GMRTNVDGTRAVLENCRRQRRRHGVPKVVFASSVAVFGGALPPAVSDATMPQPVTSYGAQKLIGETLLAEYARKGFVEGRALRLPAIVVRPGEPGLVLSSFASNVIWEALAGHDVACPVAAETALWIASPAAVVAAFVHAHELPAAAWDGHALNLPGLTVTMAEVLDALRTVGGAAAAARVKFVPDAETQRTVATWPARFATARADELRFERDAGLVEIVRAYAAEQAS
ncbi:MAG TPA: NAD-dependent epimerase/dehydratase family protein, partial [Burkholderiaceae bacterium]|nr:NAD-dependent epimerase/dehydratase family protein [Burkholderiaceae bacterium]